MSFGLAELQTIFEKISPEMRKHCCIAGGAVRDAILCREPRDIDIFVFGEFSFLFFDGLRIVEPLTIREQYESQENREVSSSRNRPWEGMVDGRRIQFIKAKLYGHDLLSLIDTFDWNVCKFAFDNAGLHCFEDPEHLFPGHHLKVGKGAFQKPDRAVKRGRDFARRYNLELSYVELRKLADHRRKLKRESRFITALVQAHVA